MATIKQIAALAGVSTATVSHVLNQTAYVSPALSQRVMKVVGELNYRPNIVARSLRTRRSRTVGMVIPNIANPFFPVEVRGVEDVLRQAGYHLIVGNSDNDPAREEEYYRTFCARKVDGLVLVVTPKDPPKYLRGHNWDETPIVFIDREYEGVPGDAVMGDSTAASYRAVSHLIEYGHRRIGIVTGPLHMLMAGRRLRGYRRALATHGIPAPPELIREGRYDISSGYEETRALLSLPTRPTAIFACSGVAALGCLRALSEAGVKCPAEMSLVSYDDLDWFDICVPRVTAVGNPAYQLGFTAAEMLVQRISKELTGPPRRKVLKANLIVRDSSARYAGAPEAAIPNGGFAGRAS